VKELIDLDLDNSEITQTDRKAFK